VKRESGFTFPGYVEYKSPKNNKPMPCCFSKSRVKKNAATEKDEGDKYYIMGETKSDIGTERASFIPKAILESLHINEKYELFTKAKRITGGVTGFFRVGLGDSIDTLPKFLKLKVKIPSPRESVLFVTKCSFMRTWKVPGTTHLDSITASIKKIPEYSDEIIAENLAKTISGIDEAFHSKTLTPLEQIEYAAIALQCDLFRIDINTKKLGCVFYVPNNKPRSRGIIIMQDEDEINILTHVTRETRGFSYSSNVFESPFKKETYVELEQLRNLACKTEIPSFKDAIDILPNIMREFRLDDYSIILDPFGRGQAFYIPDELILPFQSTILEEVIAPKISGYSDVDKLPTYEKTLRNLEVAQRFNTGYKHKEDLFNTKNQVVEILVECGLRIPIIPFEKVGEASEVIETTSELVESTLSFGKPSQEFITNRQSISYSSEVYEFLIYQLSKDIQHDELVELREALEVVKPKQSSVKDLLESWFEETTNFVEAGTPIEFLSKIRTPCGQFKSESKCSSNLCGWDEESGQCRIEIKDTLNKEKLLHRLLMSLIDNSKIRSMVLDGRTSPFFSTVLYMEMPNELIVTDVTLPD
jgi:hypothetical protein